MDEQELENLLYEALLPKALEELGHDPNTFEAVLHYDSAGLLTSDRGLVISTPGGDEFQVTIVRSR